MIPATPTQAPEHAAARQRFIDALHARLDHQPLERDAQGRLQLDAEGRPIRRTIPAEARAMAADGACGIVAAHLRHVGPESVQDVVASAGEAGVARLATDPRALEQHFANVPTGSRFTDLTTSPGDIPSLIADGLGRALADNVATARRAWRAFARPTTVPTLDSGSRGRLDDVPLADEDGTGEELKLAGVAESLTEPVALKTFRRAFRISRRMMANDDISFLSQAVRSLAQAIVRIEDRMAFGVLSSNPTMTDGTPLFDASRGNDQIGTAEGPIFRAVEALAGMADAHGDPLDLVPSTVLTPLAGRWNAETDVGSMLETTGDGISVRPRVVASPWLTGDTSYVAADPQTFAAVELVRLAGVESPTIARRTDFDTDALIVRATYHVGAVAVDPRAVVRLSPA